MYYIEVNGKIIPRPYQTMTEAQAERERLKKEMVACINVVYIQ